MSKMVERRVPYSLTVPSNFSYVHTDEFTPRTPERPASEPDQMQVVSVAPSRFRLRRHTGTRNLTDLTFAPPAFALRNSVNDVAIPSIEVAVDDMAPEDEMMISPHQAAGYLSPFTNQPYELPTTPVSQTVSFDGNSWKTARQREVGESILRPISVCSNFSNSSQESDTSSTFASSSYGGTTCTSPERGPGDPFTTPSKDERYRFSESLMADGKASDFGGPSSKTKMSWTSAMDDHLWTTYQLYLQDPTMTPIKILPGNAPPLGICHRVARKARQTWKEPSQRTNIIAAARFSTPQLAEKMRTHVDERQAVSDHESDARQVCMSGTWPKHNATRRRLRELAKNRATIPTHYMRLIASRSPSPFGGSSSRSSADRHTIAVERPSSNRVARRPSPAVSVIAAANSATAAAAATTTAATTPATSMGTRGVRLALATATSETMQPNGPVTRWQRDTPELTPEATVAEAPVSITICEPTMRIASSPPPPTPAQSSVAVAAGAVQVSPVDHLMLDTEQDQPPRLGSPFVPSRNHTWAAPNRRQRTRPALTDSTFTQRTGSPEVTARRTMPQTSLRPSTSTGPPSLRSPIQFTTFPHNRSLGKRRAENSLEDVASPRHTSHRRPALNDIFRPPLEVPNRDGARTPLEQRRVRLRGYSLNDVIMQSQQDRRTQHQPSLTNMPEADDPFTDAGSSEGVNLPAITHNARVTRQLGSPFQASAPGRPRFRVRHLPHKSLDAYPPGLFGSIGERLDDE